MAMTNKNTISTWKVVRHCVCSQVLQQQRQRQRLQKKYGYGTYTSRAYNILIPDKHPLCFCYLYFFSALSVAIASYHRILSLGSCITHHSPAIWPLRIRSTPQTHTHTHEMIERERETHREKLSAEYENNKNSEAKTKRNGIFARVLEEGLLRFFVSIHIRQCS